MKAVKVVKFVKEKRTKLYHLIILLTAVYPLLYIWQGLDFTDTGFSLTNYLWVFDDPRSIETSSRIWLTNILGGLWVHFFGDSLGVAGYRMAGAILAYAAIFMTYRALRFQVKKEYLFPGLFFAMVFIGRSGFMLNYNTLTAFFYVWSAYYLLTGLNNGKQHYLFISGAVLGLNMFIRLPNILGLMLGVCILFHGYQDRAGISQPGRRISLFLAGYGAAVLAVLTAMLFLGHLDSYLASFGETLVMLGENEGHHGTGRLTAALLDIYKISFLKAAALAGYFGILSAVLKLVDKLNIKLNNKLNSTSNSTLSSKYVHYGVITLAGLLPLVVYEDFYRNWYGMVGVVSALLFLGLALNLVRFRKLSGMTADGVISGRAGSSAALAALIILLIVPAGSADGYVTSVYGMYLAIPLAVQGIAEFNYRWGLSTEHYSYTIKLGFVLLLVLTLAAGYRYTYRDSSYRLSMAYPVGHQKLQGVLTTRERAQVVTELLEIMPEYVKEGDYLLAYEQIPLVYFLTGTRPYLYGSWPMLYSPGKFQKMLDRALAERPELPVIVRARGSTEKFDWPHSKTLRDGYYLEGSRKLMNEFIAAQNYRRAWENSFFEILTPPGK
ncbi:hypothetical protein [Phosphitispora fastidiosa]|uniref:hypothetical protein n=1 Tax=Phosphitispora fastidiosa TaxID=2837202 RepID=UPI001E557FAC|nr:hypothetical protein [Phosphitispora fastidiosa]MBU7005333.1 hypothetical protein [Phosphitispora fastidiosa]